MRQITRPSVVPIYLAAAVFALFGFVLPLITMARLAIAVLLAAGAYFISKKFFKGEVVNVIVTGDAEVDRQLKASQEALVHLREANEAIASEAVSARISRMERAGDKILAAIMEKPERADQVRRFMNYYLPTSAKLLKQYQRLLADDAQGENANDARAKIEKSLDMIALAFEKQLDNLYKDEHLDITTDIEVLEKLMAADGLIETDKNVKQGV